ncbi:MAG: type II toxin-antitoxin system VapC family toxin [Verrucomicrobiales bacterium]|jgi:tRNA(fMet)-specific endonuclease VapC|nr:type II toxin-antitoxin system VapC family toxin [Verrucomicrobiales bacterium]
MSYFLDTNICVFLLNGKFPRLTEKFLSCQAGDFCLPSMVVAELIYGARKSEKARQNMEKVQRFLRPLTVTPFDAQAAASYGELRTELEQKGRVIGPNDLVIAATTLSRNGVLVTNNIREFSRVPTLKIEDWTLSR